jgi:hypothetical protein
MPRQPPLCSAASSSGTGAPCTSACASCRSAGASQQAPPPPLLGYPPTASTPSPLPAQAAHLKGDGAFCRRHPRDPGRQAGPLGQLQHLPGRLQRSALPAV